MKRVILVAAAALIAASCEPATGPSPTDPSERQPSMAISDGMHEGDRHFFFLPPMVAEPNYSGTFDPTLSPIVRITEGMDEVAVLVPSLNVADEQYHANWHTDEYGLDPTLTYRISVTVDGLELGHADVDVVSSGAEMRNVETGEYIPLKDGRTLPIKFRIEEGHGPAGTIYYHKYVDGDYDLYRMDLATMVETPVLATPSWERYPIVSPDGSMIAFASNANSARSQLALVNADGTNLVHFPSALDQVDPTDWVGDRILLRVFEPWGSGGSAWWFSTSTGTFRLARQESGIDIYPGRGWLDDESMIVPISPRSTTGGALRQVFLDGSPPVTLWTEPSAYATANASLSHDRMRLAVEYGIGWGSIQDIYVREMISGTVSQVAPAGYGAVWSPDDRYILFHRRSGEVWLSDLAGGERALFTDGVPRRVMSWAP